jgi:hypothetical protein
LSTISSSYSSRIFAKRLAKCKEILLIEICCAKFSYLHKKAMVTKPTINSANSVYILLVVYRPYSKVNKSTRAVQVAVIFFIIIIIIFFFFHFQYSVITLSGLLQQWKSVSLYAKQVHFLIVAKTQSIITLNRKWKNNCHFCPCWFVDSWIRSIVCILTN